MCDTNLNTIRDTKIIIIHSCINQKVDDVTIQHSMVKLFPCTPLSTRSLISDNSDKLPVFWEGELSVVDCKTCTSQKMRINSKT